MKRITLLTLFILPLIIHAQKLKVVLSEEYKYGFINEKGDTIIAPIYSYAYEFSENLAAVRLYNDEDENYGSWGFIDTTGKLIIPCKYSDANSFSEGLAGVRLNKIWGFINAKGEEVIPFMFDVVKEFENGFAIVGSYRRTEPVMEDELQWSFNIINTKGEKISAKDYRYINKFHDGLAAVSLNNKWGFINTQGKLVIPLIFDDVSDFKNGKATIQQQVRKKINNKYEIVTNYNIINKKAEKIFPKNYEYIEIISNDLALAIQNKKWGIINTKGKEITSFIYSSIKQLNDSIMLVSVGGRFERKPIGGYRKRLTLVDGKWGLISNRGKEIIQAKYDEIRSYSEDLAAVMLNKKWGFINTKGKEVVALQFDSVENFKDGKAIVKKKDTSYYINLQGNIVQ